jgi:DNA polymerase/3'-5' exonuclease PolX
MRLWARKNGFSLSEKDLRPRFTQDAKGEPVPGLLTEEDVFKALGLEFKLPHERDV